MPPPAFRPTRGQRKPVAIASVKSVAKPSTTDVAISATPDSGAPAISAGARSSASPNTPPEPGRQRPGLLRGSARRKPAASNVARIQSRPRHFSPTGRCDNIRQPSSASGSSSRTGGKAEQLHREIGDDRARQAEQIVHRLGGVAERRVLHRPGGERDGAEQRQRDQGEAAQLAQAPPHDVAEMIRDKVEDVEAAIGCATCTFLSRNTATRRCSASAVVALSCTMATRI